MFIMDVPYAPLQETPIVLAQATTSAAGINTQQPDYILNACQETQTKGDPRAAWRGVDPAGLLGVYLENRDRKPVNIASIKITLLEGTKHGKIFAEVDNMGLTSYHYDPESEYLGNDKAVFMAEFEGKHYKIMVNIKVLYVIDDNSSQCPPPKLIKVNKPASGSSDYKLNFISVTFAGLDSGALGQTTGTSITLDSNAAGNNWFIDTTPADNSEFLPTSNPYEWVAKEGSAAYGKMDMLSVLLHEYGHALGIDHSADQTGVSSNITTFSVTILKWPDHFDLNLRVRFTMSPPEVIIGKTYSCAMMTARNGWKCLAWFAPDLTG